MTGILKARWEEALAAARDAAHAQETADRLANALTPLIRGRRIHCNKLGRLKGVYEITDVRAHWSGEIRAHGRKITPNGKPGTQRWDLGTIKFEDILP